MIVVATGIERVTQTTSATGATTNQIQVSYAGLPGLISLLVTLVYFAGTWIAMQGTPLDRLFGTRVVDAENGSSLEPVQALRRWIAMFWPFVLAVVAVAVPAIAGLVGLLELVWFIVLLVLTAQNREHEGPHDKFARSAVVKD